MAGDLFILILLLLPFSIDAQVQTPLQTLFHGRVNSTGSSLRQVGDVAVININIPEFSFFDCTISQGSARDLRWTKKKGVQRLPTQIFNNNLRLNFAPTFPRLSVNDSGVFICTNTARFPQQSVSFYAAIVNDTIFPEVPTVIGIVGRTVELNVNAFADPPIGSHEIRWHHHSRGLIRNDRRRTLLNSSKRLVIRNVSFIDSGRYDVEIYREIVTGVFRKTIQTKVILTAQEDRRILSGPVSILNAMEYSNVTFSCRFSGPLPLYTMSWEREGSDSLPSRAASQTDVTYEDAKKIPVAFTAVFTLMIYNVLYEDSGKYRCVGQLPERGKTFASSFAELTVMSDMKTEEKDNNNSTMASATTAGTDATAVSGAMTMMTEFDTYTTSIPPNFIWPVLTAVVLIISTFTVMTVLFVAAAIRRIKKNKENAKKVLQYISKKQRGLERKQRIVKSKSMSAISKSRMSDLTVVPF